MDKYHEHRALVKALPRKEIMSATGLSMNAISGWCVATSSGVPWPHRGIVKQLLRKHGLDDLIPFNFLGDEIEGAE